MGRAGTFRTTPRGYQAFYPSPLPPVPPVQLEGSLMLLLSDADRALGALNAVISILPQPEILVGMYVQKEALLSSQIEGTQSSLVDVLGVAPDQVPTSDVGEVVNYVRAMRHGLHRMKADGFPMSLRLIREIHAELMQDVRGGTPSLTPGEFRRSQNWIGGTTLANARFIPPPEDEMLHAMGALEGFLHAEEDLPPLVRCALIHYQFETIHPFNDGNGRVGRLLVTLYLVWKAVLDEPLLYLSAYLKAHQQEYYDRLMQVRVDGNFEAWLGFFLEGIVVVSRQMIETTRRIQRLERDDMDRLVEKGIGHAARLLRDLMKQPVVYVRDVQRFLGVSYNTANKLVAQLEGLGILRALDAQRRNRKYVYREYLAILAEGTELGAMQPRT